MSDLVMFALLGLGAGAAYALLAQGIVLIYRGSGVLNFAQGAMATLGALVFVELQDAGLSGVPAFIVAVATTALLGALFQVLVMRPLRTSAPIARVTATLALLITVEAALVLRYGADPVGMTALLPEDTVSLSSTISVGEDRLLLFGITVLLTVVLTIVYRKTRFGLATSAVAENEMVASTLSWAPGTIATVNWAVGSGLAAVAGILLAPIAGLQVGIFTLITLAALAAALVGQFTSFPLTLLGGLAIGVVESFLSSTVSAPGIGRSLPFAVIIVMLIVRGRSLPLRSHFLEKMPTVGTGRFRPVGVLIFAAVVFGSVFTWFPANWLDAFTTSAGVAVILLSVVVVTGYCGQLSLAQYGFAGAGAYIAGQLVAAQGWPVEVAIPVAVVATALIGMLVSIPALRTRGVNLAIATLGVGLAAQLIVFNSFDLTGGASGTQIGELKIFGLSIDGISHPQRYTAAALVGLGVVALVVANVRRGQVGRRMLAVRANERAAASLGINVLSTKAYAFALSGAIAAFGGMLLAFRGPSVSYAGFTVFSSINAVAFAVIGGVGFVAGGFVGSLLALGGIGSLLEVLIPNLETYLPLISGVLLLLTLLQDPDGLVAFNLKQYYKVRQKVVGLLRPRRRKPVARTELQESDAEAMVVAVRPKELSVRGLTVRFGAVTAVDDVSFDLRPGEILGLIGPNGAGKTTVIDAVSGFVKQSSGVLSLEGASIARWSASRRSRSGIARSFQSLELFDDMTVEENLRAASESDARAAFLTDLVYRRRTPLSPAAVSSVGVFNLGDQLGQRPSDLPYGSRRLVGIARAVATAPSVLLLDEPASGLSGVESRELGQLVRRMAREWNVAILLVEHDIELVMGISDRVLVMEYGKAIAEGDPETVRNDPNVVQAYLGVESTQQDVDATSADVDSAEGVAR